MRTLSTVGRQRHYFKINPWRRDVEQPVRKVIEFKDANGRVQKAALFLPRDARAEDRLPLIVTIYPGINFSRSNRYKLGSAVTHQRRLCCTISRFDYGGQ